MVITFPPMGNVSLAARAFFEAVQIPYVSPQKANKQMLQAGAALSPDEICLPFKVFMGSFADSIKAGADTVLLTGSCGPCRFGEYCELQPKLLKKNGFNAEMLVIDAPKAIGRKELCRRIRSILETSPVSGASKFKAFRQALHILSLADGLNEKAREAAGYEKNRGESKRLLEACFKQLDSVRLPDDMQAILLRYHEKIDFIRKDMNKKPIRIALIGEIYSMIEPFANLFIEDLLMEYGIVSKRLITPSWWIKDLAEKPFGVHSAQIMRAAKPHLPYNAGGHAKESLGFAQLCKNDGFDGAIQIYPLGCMPEIVAKAVLPSVQKEHGFPVLTLIIDEMTGEAGYLTRIEAFIDMLAEKRKREARTA